MRLAESLQDIRFNIFQLFSTYDGSDARLSIGPKGFTGEKYGGITYYTHDGVPIEQKQFWGVVSSCGSNGITIKRADGGTFTLPSDLSSTRVAQAGEYRLRSTGEVVSDPDFLSTWNLVKPKQVYARVWDLIRFDR
jgi:hypothetical protein